MAKNWLQVATTVILLVLLGFTAYLISINQKITATNTSILSTVEDRVNVTYSNIAADTSAWPAQRGSGVAVSVDGYKFQISSQSLPTVYFGMREALQPSDGTNPKSASSPHDVQSIINAVIPPSGYTTHYGNSNSATYVGRNNNKCLSLYSATQEIETLTCYKTSDLKRAATKLQPLVNAYLKANPSISGATFYGPATIKSQNRSGVINPSYSPGYNIAEMVINNGNDKQLALFYNKNNGPWQYITQAGDEYGFTCGSYTTNPDVRKAMYNQICLSQTGQVRLDTKNRALQ